MWGVAVHAVLALQPPASAPIGCGRCHIWPPVGQLPWMTCKSHTPQYFAERGASPLPMLSTRRGPGWVQHGQGAARHGQHLHGALPEDGGQRDQALRPLEVAQFGLGKLRDGPSFVIREDWQVIPTLMRWLFKNSDILSIVSPRNITRTINVGKDRPRAAGVCTHATISQPRRRAA